MCMFAHIVSIAKPKNIKEAMQEELHQFDRLEVLELVDKPFGKTAIGLKWLWKNKKDEDNTIIHSKARLVAKEYVRKRASNLKNLFHLPLDWKLFEFLLPTLHTS
ncbi:retrovirus-related pol polyprotein from transposon TNT 1-94, partial [Tanacetum coccineum]